MIMLIIMMTMIINKTKAKQPLQKILNSRQHFVPRGRLTGLDNISRGEGRVTEDTIRVSSEIKDSWGRRYRLSGVKSNSVQGFKLKMPIGFLLVERTQSIQHTSDQPSRGRRLITLTETLIKRDITKSETDNCFIINCFKDNIDKHTIAGTAVSHCSWKSCTSRVTYRFKSTNICYQQITK